LKAKEHVTCIGITLLSIYLYTAYMQYLHERTDYFGRSVVQTPVGSSQRLKNWQLLFPWLTFTIKCLERGSFAECQFKVTG